MMKYSLQLIAFLIFSLISPAVFAVGALDHFEIVLGKDEAKVGEALDITISAVDKNDEILTDYTGDILVFSESDSEAEFPNDLAENSYSFITANEGSIKFENAIKFNNPGLQDIYVYDLNDENILGVAEITISEDAKRTNSEIQIVSPENGVTIGKNVFLISGTTQKNHQVKIIVNQEQELLTTSNSDGIFEKEVEGLQEGANTLQAFILDADSDTIGESKKIEIKINSNSPVFKSISIDPSGEIKSETQMSVRVIASAGLRQAQVIINDVINELTEGADGIYTATMIAPKDAGEYGVDIILKDDFAHETREREVETLTVIPGEDLNAGEPEPVQVIETQPQETPVIPQVETPGVELNLKVTGITVVELKTRSVITWDELNDARSYNVYKKGADGKIELIENVKKARFEIVITGDEVKYEDFAIKAVGQSSSGAVIQGDLSEMTKVKTGPEMYILMFLIAMLASGGVLFMRREKA